MTCDNVGPVAVLTGRNSLESARTDHATADTRSFSDVVQSWLHLQKEKLTARFPAKNRGAVAEV